MWLGKDLTLLCLIKEENLFVSSVLGSIDKKDKERNTRKQRNMRPAKIRSY